MMLTETLFRANDRLSVKKSSGMREVARLTALLRKAEMNVSSMEEKIQQKVRVTVVNLDNEL